LENNGKTPVVFNCCCYAGEIDAGQNMASIWLYTPGRAAAAAIGSTRISWIGENGDLDYYLFTSIFDHNIYRVGDVLNQAKCDVMKENHTWYCTIPGKELDTAMMYLLIGEPSMDIRTEPSLEIYCMHVTSVPAAVATPVQIEVKDNINALPIPGAVVCLYKEGDVHKAYTTDNNGVVNFEITPASTGEITVTVTKHGYVPYEGSIAVE
jgi:hypothetical protein